MSHRSAPLVLCCLSENTSRGREKVTKKKRTAGKTRIVCWLLYLKFRHVVLCAHLSAPPPDPDETLAGVAAALQQLNYGALRVFNIMDKQKAKILIATDVAR